MSRWKRLYDKQGFFVCPYCLKQFPLGKATKDHVIPASRGGKADDKNLVLSCAKCNTEKGALTAEEYAEWKRLEFIRNGGMSR